METGRGLDTIWATQVLLAMRRLVTMAMWQSYLAADAIDEQVKAMDKARFAVRPQRPNVDPLVTKHVKRLMTHGAGVLGIPTIELVRPYIKKLNWRRNANYTGTEFHNNYAFAEFMGPTGHAVSPDIRLGMMVMAPETHYPPHAHPAAEVYYVLGGTTRFRQTGQPWRNCPAGQYVFHEPNVVHEMLTRDTPSLLLFWWRGDVEPMATFCDYPDDTGEKLY